VSSAEARASLAVLIASASGGASGCRANCYATVATAP
jgi:hypothetical protein